MHDTIIAKMVMDDLNKHKNIVSARIEVGELAEITAAELEKALKAMAKFRIEVTEKKAKVKCRCGHTGSPEVLERGHHFSVFACKKCGEVPEILEGNEIRIKDVDVKQFLKD